MKKLSLMLNQEKKADSVKRRRKINEKYLESINICKEIRKKQIELDKLQKRAKEKKKSIILQYLSDNVKFLRMPNFELYWAFCSRCSASDLDVFNDLFSYFEDKYRKVNYCASLVSVERAWKSFLKGFLVK